MLISHGTVVTLGADNRVIEDGALHIEGDKITAVDTTGALKARYPGEDEIDAAGRLVMPGNICAHTHFYGAFARGMAIPGEPASGFVQILQKLWWRLDRALDEEGIRLSALVCLADAIRNGTTTLFDHHASPNAIEGSLDIIAEAVQQAGVRACLCYEVTDRNGDVGAKAGIAENVRFLHKVAAQRAQLETRTSQLATLLSASFGLHASLTLSDRTLEHCAAEAEQQNAGFHTHLAEDATDEQDSLQKYGERIVPRFKRLGLLGPRTICAHGVHLDEGELYLLSETGAKLTHQPRSNANNAVGVAPVQQALDLGICVGLGNDGFSNDHFAEMKMTYLVHKLHEHDPRAMGGESVARMAFANNAHIAADHWPAPLGQLAAGAYADLILLDYHPPTPLTSGNWPWHAIFGVTGGHVHTTIVGGQVLMRDRKLLTLNEQTIAEQARECAQRTWKRLVEQNP
ncbi:MAG: putative aminohydrolase SsnA [Thermoflexales bacterium]|nr:putative aminohydrolase SsnA [Thermoflexales bacterium]